jgi:TolB-like protein/Tfp pilus assembly protein PilF/tRNA A-37 threonylcarbamoyl transferase component Bud32
MEPGDHLGPYEVVAFVGAGGMGEVYRARDERLEREVALKVLPVETLADATARARLLREARLASQLNHPNVCTIHEVGETDGRAYIAMELVEGQPLASLIAEGGLPSEQVLTIGRQLADALAHAHERGVVHRDLKSGNVIVTPEGRVKVLDFGLAKRLASEDLAAATTLTQASLTEEGAVIGTLAYIAPEQLRGEGADARSDVWALGVVLYEMAAGRRPFGGNTGYELSSAILSQPPSPLPAAVPAPLAAVIGRCLAKEPAQRYQRGGEVRAALEAVASGETLPLWLALRAWVVRHRGQTLLACASALLALLVGLDVGGVRSRLLGGPGGRAIRMAVLPFANLSGAPDQDYLSDGLTQEMIAQLGRLHPESLSVIARTSVMRYKKTETPIDQIGRELGVEFVLEGSAQREGSRVKVSAELIRVKGQAQLWADTYERELAGALVLESEVAQKVAEALALKLLPEERTHLASARAVNAAAYDAYLKGSQYWTRLTAADLDTAERYFNLALEKDPTFAPAHAGLAMVWACRQQMGFAPPSQAGPKAKTAARRALELDDTVALAHFAMAAVLTWTDWDWAAAGREWARAIELDPGDAVARADYSHYLMHVGRPDEAMAQIETALKTDPLNVIPRIFYGVDLIYLRRYEEAMAAFREALRMQPGEPAAVAGMWPTLARLGRKKEAFEFAKQYLLVVYQDHRAEQACDQGYAQGGYAEAMRRAAEALAARFRTSYAVPTDVAWFYLEAGDKARALDWLEKGYELRDPSMPYLGWGYYDGLRSEPRFQALLRKMDLPQT